jgi:integrase
MGEANLAPTNLYLAVPTKFAPRSEIVTVMSDDMIDCIYDYRKNASNPLELRNAAMVLLGLRMGIRSCDIVNLKISDFDWANQTVSFIQKKTRKTITLHIPTDAGNSVYRYISQGRPQSRVSSAGFVFIRHMAPYSELTNSVCGYAIKHALSVYGLKLPHRQGFHITRRTFATRLLKAGTKVDSIVDALGHTSRKSIDAYMAHDEEGMLLCPLSFTVGGAV